MLEFDSIPGDGGGTLVLLHSLALDRSIWEGFLQHVGNRFDVVIPDLPGHGASNALADTSIESIGSEVANMVRDLTADPAIFIGLSLGGCVAQAIAINQPEVVRGLGLVDTTCWYGETAKADWNGRAQKAISDGLGSLAAFQLARWFTAEFLEQGTEVADRLLETFKSMRLASYVATCRAMGAMDLREEIGTITVPTTVLVGALDSATPVTMAEELERRIPGASLHVMANCSHLSAVERPDVVARLLAEDLFARL